MKREIIRVEPLATYLEKYKAPASMVTKHGDTTYVSGSPPFDPKTGEIFRGPIERQTEVPAWYGGFDIEVDCIAAVL
jgi:2-iminobutanoate/2-iminopropanoate deaminase